MPRLKAAAGESRIRMYRHGLGDCFLLAFGAKNHHQKYVLIDCGVLLGTAGADEKMIHVVKDIEDATGGHIHALVVTHEHWDHISGFAQAQAVFDHIAVDALWLAWTEDTANPLAESLRERKRQAFAALQGIQLHQGASQSAYSKRVTNVLEFFGPTLGVAGRTTTEGTMDWLKTKWNNHVYCSPGDPPLIISGLPEVRFFVLGPPQDERYIKKSRPSQRHSEVYLDDSKNRDMQEMMRALGVSDPADPNKAVTRQDEEFHPFNPAYELEASDATVKPMHDRYAAEPWRHIENNWEELAGELALRLDAHTNNTSLVLAIELSPGGKVLLFPGDAQVGNWLSWPGVVWPDEDGLTADDLLKRTVFYKVGHHGSHNATLSEHGLEKMSHDHLTAFIPVDKKVAAKRRWHMPHIPLHERLIERTSGRVILSDEGISGMAADGTHAEFLTNVGETELYIEIVIQS